MATLARPAVSLDRVALTPGDLLGLRDRWHPQLDALPPGGVLMLLPSDHNPLRPVALLVAALLEAMGHPVTSLEAARFRVSSPPETQGQLL